jgi:hypothetical protein
MGFCEKVDATPDISGCAQAGLRAIKGGDRAKFVCPYYQRKLTGQKIGGFGSSNVAEKKL